MTKDSFYISLRIDLNALRYGWVWGEFQATLGIKKFACQQELHVELDLRRQAVLSRKHYSLIY